VAGAHCPAEAPKSSRFTVVRDFDDPIIQTSALFLTQNGIEIAGIEFIRDAEARIFTYDVNTNTNAQAETAPQVRVTGMQAIARFLGEELAKQRARAARMTGQHSSISSQPPRLRRPGFGPRRRLENPTPMPGESSSA
jgi:hypothetical protein